VNVFRTPDGFLIALAYGRESEWVKNVMAAAGCQLETRGVWSHLSAPTIVQFSPLYWTTAGYVLLLVISVFLSSRLLYRRLDAD
jgi:hypothetical protein